MTQFKHQLYRALQAVPRRADVAEVTLSGDRFQGCTSLSKQPTPQIIAINGSLLLVFCFGSCQADFERSTTAMP
jgi:hypothetical protein